MELMSFLQRLVSPFRKTNETSSDNPLAIKIQNLFNKDANDVVGDDILDELERILISSDIGTETMCMIMNSIEEKKKYKKIKFDELNTIITDIFIDIISLPSEDNPTVNKPHVIMITGVNGVGKTTTIAKLAYMYKNKGQNVIVGAADTFRAAAIEQLEIWCNKVEVDVVIDKKASPSTVAYNTVKQAMTNNFDVAIIDTAGRLHNNEGLMDELGKVKRTITKLLPTAPHETILVLDATAGQTIFQQIENFVSAVNVNELVITKMDGIAKSGFIVGAINKFHIPVKYIGTGEKVTDLQVFNPKEFIQRLMSAN